MSKIKNPWDLAYELNKEYYSRADIDDMLFWTDNHNEPKKINIPDCIQGSQIDTYTRLVNPERNINFSDNIEPLSLDMGRLCQNVQQLLVSLQREKNFLKSV